MGCGASVVRRYAPVANGGGQTPGCSCIGLQTLQGVPVPEEFQRRSSQIAQTEDRGISIKQLKHLSVFCQSVFECGTCKDSHTGQIVDWDTASKYNINEFITTPLTVPFKCSTVELMAWGPQQPTWFVSHSWFHGLRETLMILAFHAESREEGEGATYYYWICTFANNQHDLGELAGSLQDTPFFKAMKLNSCQGTIALICQSALLFSRMWCLYESYISLQMMQDLGKSYLYDVGTFSSGNSSPPYEFQPGVIIQLDLDGGSYKQVSSYRLGIECYDEALHLNAGRPGVEVRPALGAIGVDLDKKRADYLKKLLGDKAEVKAIKWNLPADPVFPGNVGWAAMAVDVAEAKASRPEDRKSILHLIAGTQPSACQSEPPATHESYERLNKRIKARFATSALCTYGVVGNVEKVQEIIDHYPDSLLRECNSNGDGALAIHACAMYGHVEVMRLVLAAKANVDAKAKVGGTPLSIAMARGHVGVVAELLNARADTEDKCSMTGRTPMDLAFLRGQDDECATLLLSSSPMP